MKLDVNRYQQEKAEWEEREGRRIMEEARTATEAEDERLHEEVIELLAYEQEQAATGGAQNEPQPHSQSELGQAHAHSIHSHPKR